MDQKKIGTFFRALRKEKGITQEQLAEQLGVSNRTVSRWETGSNLPDFDLLILLAQYYGVTMEEIFQGERSTTTMDLSQQETFYQIAEYTNNEKEHFTRRLHGLLLLGTACCIVYAVVLMLGLETISPYQELSSFCLGLACAMLLVGTLFTSRFVRKLHQAKLRICKSGICKPASK